MHPRTSSAGLIVFAILHHVFLAFVLIFNIMIFADGVYNREQWMILGLAASIPTAVFHALILHRGWKSVQDGGAATTPGKAVGYCFIPFFNLYWLAEARGRQEQKVTDGFALTYCILIATIFFAIFAAAFGVVFVWQTIGAVKNLENA